MEVSFLNSNKKRLRAHESREHYQREKHNSLAFSQADMNKATEHIQKQAEVHVGIAAWSRQRSDQCGGHRPKAASYLCPAHAAPGLVGGGCAQSPHPEVPSLL